MAIRDGRHRSGGPGRGGQRVGALPGGRRTGREHARAASWSSTHGPFARHHRAGRVGDELAVLVLPGRRGGGVPAPTARVSPRAFGIDADAVPESSRDPRRRVPAPAAGGDDVARRTGVGHGRHGARTRRPARARRPAPRVRGRSGRPPHPGERFDARFDVLLRRAASAGVAVLVVGVSDGTPLPGAGTAALAERLGVAVVATPDPWAASVRVHELIGSGDAPAARAAVAAARIGLDGRTPALDELFVRLESELGHASGSTTRRVARSVVPASHRRPRRCSPARSGRADRSGRATTGETVVAVPVPTGIGPRAWLAVGHDARARRAGGARDGAPGAAVAAGHRLVLTRLDDERDARYRMAMLDDLRAADGAPAPPLVQRTIAAGWELDARHDVVRLVARGPVDAVALRREVETTFDGTGSTSWWWSRPTGGRSGPRPSTNPTAPRSPRSPPRFVRRRTPCAPRSTRTSVSAACTPVRRDSCGRSRRGG